MRGLNLRLSKWAVIISASLWSSNTLAQCAPSAARQPQGLVGLQPLFADDARTWDWVDELRVTYVRIEMRWDWLEPYDGQYDWSYIDRVMALAKQRSVRIMLLFNHVPGWASKDTNALPSRSARALGALVQRYRFSAYEIFNEPNLAGQGWVSVSGGATASAKLYAQVLAASSAAVRGVDKDAIIISAGLSPQGDDPEAFLREVVRQTPPQCYDAIGAHPYGMQGRFNTVRTNVATLLSQEGRPPKPTWFTEYGTPSDPERETVVRQLFKERSEAPVTFWYSERDVAGWFSEPYGLRKNDGSPKPSYGIFKELMGTAQ